LRRVTNPTVQDQKKLDRVLKYINYSRSLPLILGVGDTCQVSVYADASFAVHEDRKSHTGISVTLGRGAILAHSSIQRLVTKSSTEAELVAASLAGADLISIRNFLYHQKYGDNLPGILHQDNEASMKLISKGYPCSARTRHVDIQYFWLADRIEKKEVDMKWTSTKEMISDILTKPLVGIQFTILRDKLIGTCESQTPHEECVGKIERNDDQESVGDGIPRTF